MNPTLDHLKDAIRMSRDRDGDYVTIEQIAELTPYTASTWRRVLAEQIELRVAHLEMITAALAELTGLQWRLSVTLEPAAMDQEEI